MSNKISTKQVAINFGLLLSAYNVITGLLLVLLNLHYQNNSTIGLINLGVIIGVIFCLIGIVGSFLPILPGPIASWFGLLILHFTSYVSFSFWFLTITFLIAFLISVIDYVIPIIGVQKLGGSNGGQIGATIGLLLGLFILGPIGLIFGPFLGALTGEIIAKKTVILSSFC